MQQVHIESRKQLPSAIEASRGCDHTRITMQDTAFVVDIFHAEGAVINSALTKARLSAKENRAHFKAKKW